MRSKKLIGFSSLFITAAIFGSFGVWIRILSEELTTYQQIVFRNLFALLFTIIFIVFLKVNLKALRKVNKIKLVVFTTIVPLAVITYVFAMLSAKIMVVTFAFYAGTILTSWTLGIIFFKEKITRIGLISLLFAISGLLVLAYPFSLATLSYGFVIAALSGFFDSVGHVFRKDLVRANFNKFLLVLLTAIGGVLVSSIMILYSDSALNFLPQLSLKGWVVGGVFGFFLVAVNYLLLVGFQNFDLSLGSIVLVAELFFATVFGMVFLGEYPSRTELMGGFLVLVACVLPNVKEVVGVYKKG